MSTAGKDKTAYTIILIGAFTFLFFGALGILHTETILKITNTSVHMNAAARTFANIFVARNLPLGVFPFAMLAIKNRHAVAYSAYLMAAIQLIDFIYAIPTHYALVIVAPIVVGVPVYLSGRYLLHNASLNDHKE